MAVIPLMEPVYKGNQGPVFFAAGFRPFFLFAALHAAAMVPLWLAVYFAVLPLGGGWNPLVWHGHSMIFGFAGAAIGGFLLTAVPNWTNTHHVSGKPLMLLFILWLAGRAGTAASGLLPPVLVAALDLAYLPLLAGMLAKPLMDAGKWRNIAFLPILGVLWVADLLIHLDVTAGFGTGLKGIYIGLFVVLLMIVIVGGRIIPSFTQNWLRMQGQPVEMEGVPWVEKGGAALSLIATAVATILEPGTSLSGGVALLAAAIHFYRMVRWHGVKTVSNPILVVLHVGYLWLVIGLALLGISAFLPVLPASAAVHALTAGCVGTMVIAVMSRAALGHSGRPLEVAPLTVAAYVLISVGAALRVLAPVMPGAMAALTLAGGVVWTAGWLAYAVVYWPVTTRPRADGKPG